MRRHGIATGALLAVLGGAGVALPEAAGANSVASVVAAPDGRVYFSDYILNRIWEVSGRGALRVVIRGKHTHHLALGRDGSFFGENVPPDRRWPSLWRMAPDGTVTEVPSPGYEGTVFGMSPDGTFVYVKQCRIVRLSREGVETPVAGLSCGERAWKDDVLRYGHLHGSLALAADGRLYFSDARTVRRVAADGTVSTLGGKPVALFADPQPGEARFDRVMGLAVDVRGNLFVADRKTRGVIRIAPGGRTSLYARLGALTTPIGLGLQGEDLLVVTQSRLSLPAGLTRLAVRRIYPDGTVTFLARTTRRSDPRSFARSSH